LLHALDNVKFLEGLDERLKIQTFSTELKESLGKYLAGVEEEQKSIFYEAGDKAVGEGQLAGHVIGSFPTDDYFNPNAKMRFWRKEQSKQFIF